jgi:hypothetical protein
LAKTEQDRCLFTSLNYSVRRSLQTFGRISGGLPSPIFSTTLSRVRSLLEACEMMVNSGKACLASESFLGLDMTIPTEPIGSIPRPQKVITAFEQYERGSLSREEFESICNEAVRETIEKFEATGSPVITDGEQTGTFANFLNSPQGPFDIKPTHRATFRQRRNLRVFQLSKPSSLPQRSACCIRRTVFLTIHRKNFSKI